MPLPLSFTQKLLSFLEFDIPHPLPPTTNLLLTTQAINNKWTKVEKFGLSKVCIVGLNAINHGLKCRNTVNSYATEHVFFNLIYPSLDNWYSQKCQMWRHTMGSVWMIWAAVDIEVKVSSDQLLILSCYIQKTCTFQAPSVGDAKLLVQPLSTCQT